MFKNGSFSGEKVYVTATLESIDRALSTTSRVFHPTAPLPEVQKQRGQVTIPEPHSHCLMERRLRPVQFGCTLTAITLPWQYL